MINWGYVLILFLLGFFVYWRKSLDLLGTITMIVMGIVIIFSAGLNWLILLIIFLVLSLLATKFAKPYKRSINEYEGQRTAKNVISNGLLAFLMAAFGGYYLPFVGGFIGAVATATADTLASEIGVLQKPRLLTTFEEVPAGTDGAVSILGTSAAILGAGIIGLSSYFLGIVNDPILGLKIGVISGTVGCFMDSFVGDKFERKGYLNNEHVNLIGTLTGTIIGILCIF